MKSIRRAVLIALGLTGLLRGFVLQGFRVPSGSMLPSLQIGDQILVSRLRYGIAAPWSGGWLLRFAAPRPGDVVVLTLPNDPASYFVKRVVAVPGEVVTIREGRLYVDDMERESGAPPGFPEILVVPEGAADFEPLRVPPGHVFVLGDDRSASIDSRVWGPISTDGIKGKVFLVYWSQKPDGGAVRWERIGSLVN